MRHLIYLFVLVFGLSFAQYSATPRFENYGGAAGIFPDPATDSRINPARIGTNSSSIWIPVAYYANPTHVYGGLQYRFAWTMGLPFEFDLGGEIDSDTVNNPAGDLNVRFGFSVPNIPIQASETEGMVPVSVGFEVFGGGQFYGTNLQNSPSSQNYTTYMWLNSGIGIGVATPDFDLVFNLENVVFQQHIVNQVKLQEEQFTKPSLFARVKSGEYSVIGSYEGGINPGFSLGGGWQTKVDSTRVGVWGRAYSDTDVWIGSNVETPLAAKLNFLGSWSLYRDDVDGFSPQPLRLAVVYRDSPMELSFELPLYFQGSFFQAARVSAGFSW